jgi:hypothetical protein
MINYPNIYNLTPIFETIEPVFKAAPAALQFDLQELITALYLASPSETTYFLQQILKGTRSAHPAVALRRMLPDLPPELQVSLREILRETR